MPGGRHPILDFDDRVVAPANGFSDALDYYAQCSSAPRLGAIRTPTLIIHAKDDPWISSSAFRAVDWEMQNVSLLMPWSGGHVGFHAMGLKRAWHDEVALRLPSRRPSPQLLRAPRARNR